MPFRLDRLRICDEANDRLGRSGRARSFGWHDVDDTARRCTLSCTNYAVDHRCRRSDPCHRQIRRAPRGATSGEVTYGVSSEAIPLHREVCIHRDLLRRARKGRRRESGVNRCGIDGGSDRSGLRGRLYRRGRRSSGSWRHALPRCRLRRLLRLSNR